MELTVRTQPRIDGQPGQDIVIEGDTAFFFWLLTAAGNARDGFEGNFAHCTDGTGNRVALQPSTPLQRADQNWRSRTAHVSTAEPPRPPAPTLPPPGIPAVTTEPPPGTAAPAPPQSDWARPGGPSRRPAEPPADGSMAPMDHGARVESARVDHPDEDHPEVPSQDGPR